MEWAMLYSTGVFDASTQTVAVVHECQVLDEELMGEEWDTGCDYISTNRRMIDIEGASKPRCGIPWDVLEDGMWNDIEPQRVESSKTLAGNSLNAKFSNKK